MTLTETSDEAAGADVTHELALALNGTRELLVVLSQAREIAESVVSDAFVDRVMETARLWRIEVILTGALKLAVDRNPSLESELDQAFRDISELTRDLFTASMKTGDFVRQSKRSRFLRNTTLTPGQRDAIRNGLILLDGLLRAAVSKANTIGVHLVAVDTCRVSAHVKAVPPAQNSNQLSISPVALRLTALAARSLPAAHRARYRDEFAAELYGLAQASRLAQCHHAFNVVVSVWKLGAVLRKIDRSPATQRRPG